MFNIDEIISYFVILWAVIDPIGTVPVFLAVTKNYEESEKKKIARFSSLIAFFILLFFMIVGEILLRRVGVPLAAFQTSGGIILFLFALNMIFGDSKPEEEIQLVKKTGQETAIFPLAIPSIAGPGAILAVVLLADSTRSSLKGQTLIASVMCLILFINYVLMRLSGRVHKKIGDSGAIVISKVMGLILASIAANNILLGIKDFFKIL
ncbi:MAG: MarC family protein [Bacteriovoracaceae bacterium]|jgi:multiple antibiotic resistance protein|nr:MarC family transcriptional regulator [Halobacteriovoraceae bacterium]MDP7322028.1 MarC family protein [Bacteriovoracaceae bacterium]